MTTPRQIDYGYKFMFEDKSVLVKAYTLETIIAEKYETVIRRNIGNTRARDFYDLFVLIKIKKDEIRWNVLEETVLATATKRDSLEELTEYKEIIEDIQESQFLERIWEKYKEENTYSEGIAIPFDLPDPNYVKKAKHRFGIKMIFLSIILISRKNTNLAVTEYIVVFTKQRVVKHLIPMLMER